MHDNLSYIIIIIYNFIIPVYKIIAILIIFAHALKLRMREKHDRDWWESSAVAAWQHARFAGSAHAVRPAVGRGSGRRRICLRNTTMFPRAKQGKKVGKKLAGRKSKPAWDVSELGTQPRYITEAIVWRGVGRVLPSCVEHYQRSDGS